MSGNASYSASFRARSYDEAPSGEAICTRLFKLLGSDMHAAKTNTDATPITMMKSGEHGFQQR